MYKKKKNYITAQRIKFRPSIYFKKPKHYGDQWSKDQDAAVRSNRCIRTLPGIQVTTATDSHAERRKKAERHYNGIHLCFY